MQKCHDGGQGSLSIAVMLLQGPAQRLLRFVDARFRTLVVLSIFTSCLSGPALAWEHWGGDRGGTRFSALNQITPSNVNNLIRAWEFRTGDLAKRTRNTMTLSKFQSTPLFVEGRLVFCTPFNEVIALHPGTGAQIWRFDVRIDTEQRPADRYNCRGVAFWEDIDVAKDAICRSRIFMGTNDARLIALDAKTGMPCPGFGENGQYRGIAKSRRPKSAAGRCNFGRALWQLDDGRLELSSVRRPRECERTWRMVA